MIHSSNHHHPSFKIQNRVSIVTNYDVNVITQFYIKTFKHYQAINLHRNMLSPSEKIENRNHHQIVVNRETITR